MKVAVVGSGNLTVALSECIPEGTTEIISGGGKSISACAQKYAEKNKIPFLEFWPDYEQFGKFASLICNDRIIRTADIVLVFWNGRSKGTKYVVDRCRELEKPIQLYRLPAKD